jgi:hypothetical protein
MGHNCHHGKWRRKTAALNAKLVQHLGENSVNMRHLRENSVKTTDCEHP